MIETPEVSVTLSKELYRQLRAESRRLGLPLEWVVASMVADTIESREDEPVAA